MFAFKEWSFAWEEYILLRFTIMEWIREQTIIMKRTVDIEAAETLTEVQKLQDELDRFKSEDLAQKEVCFLRLFIAFFVTTLLRECRNLSSISEFVK